MTIPAARIIRIAWIDLVIGLEIFSTLYSVPPILPIHKCTNIIGLEIPKQTKSR